MRYRYLTTTIGVDPSHREKAFYRLTLDHDASRVNSLFERARECNIAIESKSLSPSELRSICSGAHTRGGNLIIGLVDRRHLYHPAVKTNSEALEGTDLNFGARLGSSIGNILTAFSSIATGAFETGFSTGGYLGHYILITSYNAQLQGYYILDPAGADDYTFIPDENLNAARKSHGTDEDLLVIPLDQPPLAVIGNTYTV